MLMNGSTACCSISGKVERDIRLPRQHLDLAIEARFHFEVAVVNLTFAAGNGDVVALLENDPGKRADRLLDHIAPGVRTDHAVFAKASPPFSLTSLRVITAAR